MVYMGIKEEKILEFGLHLKKFLDTIHGENPFEIRMIPEKKGLGQPIHILRDGRFLYTNNSKNEKVKVCEYNPIPLANYLNGCLMFAGHTAVCFTVNSPNANEMSSCITQNQHIINGGTITCQFVDIDAPKDIRYDKDVLNSWKLSTKKRILSFELKPSIIVETKNGYHVYWLLENGEHLLFKQIQMQLIKHFDADEQCKNEARLLRLPFFQHRKDIDDPYEVKVRLLEPNRKYTQEEIKSWLPVELEGEVQSELSNHEIGDESYTLSGDKKGNILNLLDDKIYEHTVSRNDKQIRMHCIFPEHPDRRPSAWIDTEYMYYHCAGCGRNYSLIDLAEELNWTDIKAEWNRYEINIHSELEKLKEYMFDVKDIVHLSTNETEQASINAIAEKVINILASYSQIINDKHSQYIYDIVRILYKSNKEKPYLLPLDMGGGKSLIIDVFLQEMAKSDSKFSAIVCVQRVEDVIRIANEINTAVGEKVALKMYGFKEDECEYNKSRGKNYKSCIAKNSKSCPYKSNCRYYNQSKDKEHYPIIVMTSKRLSLVSDKLDGYSQFETGEEKINRELLIIDEKPEMIFIETLNKANFEEDTISVLKALEDKDINGDMKAYAEFENAVKQIKVLLSSGIEESCIIPISDKRFNFTKEFWGLFTSIYDYNDELYKLPSIIESIIKHGGYYELAKGEIKITTSHMKTYKKFKNFRTIIFDGTADIDMEYNHSGVHLLNFEPLRTYEGLTIHKCDSISGTKTNMRKHSNIVAFCDEVKKIADENQNEKLFVPVFKYIKYEVEMELSQYIESGRIIVAHFGSTRGSNKFKDCSIVVIGGILHKTENYYLGKAKTLLDSKGIELIDMECSTPSGIRRFNDSNIEKLKILDMLVDYSQEIKRSSQRDNTRNVPGQVYIFHNDNILLDLISFKFPKCSVREWTPMKMLEAKIFSKGNNRNVKAVYKYIAENCSNEFILYKDIRESANISKPQQLTAILKRKDIEALIKSNGYEIQKCVHDKRERQLVKVS